MSWTDDFHGELTTSNLRLLEEVSQKGLLFKSIRACDLHAIRTILQANRNLLNSKMYGYEGTDVFEVIKNSKTKRCYTFTGLEKDGFFYPLHVATESGHKNLAILLVKAGADVNLTDYRGCTAEEKCTGNALHAFYELQGLKFDAKERFQGKLDRNGQRNGQGIVFFKPEGYLMKEMQLYRGTFKCNVYHGHGSLYFPGTETIAYVGRFKNGVRHGRGIEFDLNGNKAYQGTFRDDKRAGRGDEYDEAGNRIYRGEWANNVRHGFGVAYFSEGSKYFGRYENNMMSGVGIYCHPNNDRFEGMFFNNKPDGPGSFYEKGEDGTWIAHHAIWQVGRKVKENSTPFIPTIADLPDDSTQHMFAEIMNSHTSSSEDKEGQEGNDPAAEMPLVSMRRVSFSYFDNEPTKDSVSKNDWWKVQLGKYLKLRLSEAVCLGLEVPSAVLAELEAKVSPDENGTALEETDGGSAKNADGDDDIDEVMGYHFMECTPLFVGFVYVNSAAKVFEDRLVNKGLTAEFPDFEAVYHLVIEAVDSYNDLWEDAYREHHYNATAEARKTPKNQDGGTQIEMRRMAFMTEKEKKEEIIIRQRAELAIKKGTAELDEQIEKQIGAQVLSWLESELNKLLTDSEELIPSALHISRKNNIADSIAENKADSKSIDPKRSSKIEKKDLQINVSTGVVNIEDIFDLAIDSPGYSPILDEQAPSVEEDDGQNHVPGHNDFAAELLYVMKSAIALS